MAVHEVDAGPRAAGAGGLRRTREVVGERVGRPMREAVHEPRRERGASSAC